MTTYGISESRFEEFQFFTDNKNQSMTCRFDSSPYEAEAPPTPRGRR